MPFADPSTRTTLLLREWELGNTAAEHLCADILRLDGFDRIDPQLPTGGPDGGKDILCEKQGIKFVAASYFPTSQVKFAKIRKKFRDDVDGASAWARPGFIFMTGQKLTPTERIELEKIAAAAGMSCLIYHRERLRVVLDSPSGYGIRLRHLRVALAPEEQFAYFAATESGVATAIEQNTKALQALSGRIDRLSGHQAAVARATLAAVESAVGNRDEGVDLARMLQAAADQASAETVTAVSGNLTADLVRYVHRLLLWPVAPTIAGRFRQTEVFLKDPTGSVNDAVECPPWDQVPDLLEALVTEWIAGHSARRGDRSRAIADMARFYRGVLHIHPFTDGNGRLARELLSLQARELLGVGDEVLLEQGPMHYVALQEADAGDFEALEQLIEEAVERS